MSKKIGSAFAVILALAVAAMLGGCASSQSSSSSASSGAVAASDKSIETGEYSGTLAMAYDNKITVAGEDGDQEFALGFDTVYKLGDPDELCLDDVVKVAYHVEGENKLVDQVTLVEHIEDPLEFAGTLVDWDNETITLVDGNLTVTFQKDADSYLVGDLSQGDQIELTYYGNLSEYPYASVIAVVTEAEQPQVLTVRGVVSEFGGGTLLLGIDSANAYRLAVTNNTKVTGAANDVKAGDQVAITYAGSIKNVPEAQEINIVRQGQDRAYVINGKIADVAQNSVTLETSAAKYTFATNNNTRFNGDKPAKGYSSEITYTGALNDKPVATVVYCVKSEQAAAKLNAKNQSAKSNGSSKADASSSKDKDKTNQAISKTNQDGTQGGKAQSQKQQASQGSASQGDAVETQSTEAEPVEPEAVEEQPEATEEEPEATEEEPEATEPEPEATEEEPEATEPEPEATEPEPEATEPEPEPEPEVAAAPEPDVTVSGKGTIIKGDESASTVKIEVNGSTITLSFDGSAKVSSGYIPQKGDVVKIKYGSTSMLLKSIQLVSRAADDDEDDEGDEE